MTSQADAASLKVAKALSYVCTYRDELTALLDDEAVTLHALEAAVDHAADSTSITELLNALHAAVRRAGDPSGVYEATGRSLTPAGVSSLDIIYRCPLQLCIGRAGHEVGGDAPHCTFARTGAALIRERLP
jgi:hypothetical protein